MNNTQRWMGGVVLLGGGVLLAALLLKGKDEIDHQRLNPPEQGAQVESNEMAGRSSLAVDVETEKRLLEQQRRDREKAVAEQEARAAEFLAMQQQAEADAARKAAEEYAALNAHRIGQQSSDNIPPELVEDEQAKQKRLAEDKAAAQKKLEQQKQEQQLAQQKAVTNDAVKKEAERKAAEEKRKTEERKAAEKKEAERKAAEEKRKAEQHKAEEQRKADEKKEAERKAAEEKRKAEEKQKAEEKRKAEEAKKKAEAEKARKLLEGDNDKQWMVQVALAANEANADAVAAKLRAKGYKVTKSPTSKGIRIMVGPSKDRESADALRKKIAADASLNMKSAWVNEWVPLDKR